MTSINYAFFSYFKMNSSFKMKHFPDLCLYVNVFHNEFHKELGNEKIFAES